MRYIYLLLFLLLVWFLVDEFILQDRSDEGLTTVRDKWKDLGSRFHLVFGILAVLILAFLLIRLVIDQVW